MARARSLKPKFFTNDKLAELPPLVRLLFAGLWCIADREGRLEDRPARIKVDVLPYDKCHVDKMLQSLHDHGFIQRYTVGGLACIQIINFLKHQDPHYKERASEVPPSPSYDDRQSKADDESTVGQSTINDESTVGQSTAYQPPNSPPLTPLTCFPLPKTSVVPTPTIYARASAGNNAFEKNNNPKTDVKTHGRWDASEAATDAKGRELGVPAKPGEDYFQYRRRLWSAINERTRSQRDN